MNGGFPGASMTAGLLACLGAPDHRDEQSSVIPLEWHAPAGCPDATALRAKVEQLLGARATGFDTSGLRAVAEQTNDGTRWRLQFEIISPTGTSRRAVDAPQCETLAGFVAIEIAFAIDPVAAFEHVEIAADLDDDDDLEVRVG